MSDTFRDYSQTQRIPKAKDAGTPARGSFFDYDIPVAGGSRSSGSRTAQRGGSDRNSSGRRSGSAPRRGGDLDLSFTPPPSRSGGAGTHARGGSAFRASPAPRQGGSSAAARRRRKKQERAVALGMLFLAALLGTTIFVVVRSCRPSEPLVLDPATDTIRNNVTINGFDVSGMTIDQARSVVSPAIEQNIAQIAITLAGEGFSERITGEQMNASSDLEQVLSTALAGGANESYTTTLSLDYAALDARITDINAALSFGATDATFTLEASESGKPQLNYVEGKAGMGLDVEATERLVREALDAGNYNATITPALTTVQPSVTVADLKAQVTEIGRFTTEYGNRLPSNYPEEERMVIENRAFNVEKCAALINGQVIRPGQSWSFNKTVGDRNEKNGWKQAKGIYGGEAYTMQYGGGVCQVSTTLYVALMRAGIPFAEVSRREHSIPSTYVPLGFDATVDTGHIDFKFKNTTEYPLYIFAYSTVQKSRTRYSDLTVVIYGQALPEGVTYDLRSVTIEELQPGDPIITYDNTQTTDYNATTVSARTGYVVDVYRDQFLNGERVSSEKLYEDRYEAITAKITVGTLQPTVETPKPTSVPSTPTAPPVETPIAGTEDMP